MQPVVLFVDDEPNLIAGMKRATRKFRDKWEMHFAVGAEEALKIINEKQVNTVVTDMRMPGIDGAQLLRKISNDWPGIFRIVLSGEADAITACDTVGRSHLFLSKPCEYEKLFGAIQQPFIRSAELADKGFTGNLAYFDCIRAKSGNLVRLKSLLNQDTTDMEKICALIMSDPSLAVRVLQITNSSYFGRPVYTPSIEKAVKRLGADVLRAVINADRFGEEFEVPFVGQHEPTETALAAQKIAADMGGEASACALAYSTALFSNLGKTIPLDASDESELGFRDHADLPVFLAAIMGLPEELLKSMDHVQSHRSKDWDPAQVAQLAAIGAIANVSNTLKVTKSEQK